MTKIDTSTEAVEALLKDVTPGPFIVDDFGIERANNCRIAMPDRNGVPMATVAECFQNWNDAHYNERRISWKEAQANASFLAASRQLVPALLAERDQLRDELDAAYAIIAAERGKVMRLRSALVAITKVPSRMTDADEMDRIARAALNQNGKSNDN